MATLRAIFTITTGPYIAYTSNIFAILGLRALFRPRGSDTPRLIAVGIAVSMYKTRKITS
ncbi:MAG: hypothetical protein J0L97_08185 [Alphaproteobacteria bacterium]|nr:hypothetical protein [Alphaproteobacteria bacterium]